MIRKTLATLALGSALTVLAPVTLLAKDRDDRGRDERRSEQVSRERRDRDHWRKDRDRDDRYRGRYAYANGWYDQFGYWHPYVRR